MFYRQPLWFLKATFGYQAKVTQKVRKSASNIKVYFEQFFIFLEKISTFITFLLKKAFCYRYVAYLRRNTHAELLHGCSAVNCLNIRRTPFLKNTSGWLLLYIWKWIQHKPTGIHLFRIKIEKLQSTKLTIKHQNDKISFSLVAWLLTMDRSHTFF